MKTRQLGVSTSTQGKRTTSMNAIWTVQLLGGLRARRGDQEIARFSTQKNAMLLAYLAYYRHQQHPREVLLELLWPDCDPEAGKKRLRTALWSLRRQLEPPGTSSG